MSKPAWKNIDQEEKIFQCCLWEFHQVESCRSTGEIDMTWHIDLFLGNGLSVDVKRQKKVYGTDKEPSEKYTWLEFNNSSGRRGWLYGRATHIAFAMGSYYLLVDRKQLLDYSLKILEVKNLLTETGKPKATRAKGVYLPYVVYTKNNLDRVMLVEVADLKELKHLIVRRDADKCH